MIYLIFYIEYSADYPNSKLVYGCMNKEEALKYWEDSRFRNPPKYSEFYELYEVNGSNITLIASKDNYKELEDEGIL